MEAFHTRIRRGRIAANVLALALTAALTMALATGCGSPSAGGSGGSSSTGGAASSTLLAFSQCMRSRGLPNFPDPQASDSAKLPGAQSLGVSSSRYQAAVSACQHLLPAGADDEFPAAEVQQLLFGMRAFSQCMRSHGVRNWPDPSVNSAGQPLFDLGAHGITRADARSPQIVTRENECQRLLPSALGGIPVD